MPEPSETDRILGRPYRSLTVGIVTLVLLVAFEAMAVTTVMPLVVRELNGFPLYAWGFSAFIMGGLFATIVAGELADRLGPVRPFVVGVCFFAAGLLLAGCAPNMPVFIAGRAVQGLGGSAFFVSLLVVASRAYPTDLLPRVMAAISSAWVLPAIIGPILAGTIAHYTTWRTVFIGLVPLSAVPLAMVLPHMRGLRRAAEPTDRQPDRKRLALAVALGVGLIQYAGQTMAWSSLLVLAVGVALLVPSLPGLVPPGTLTFERGIPSIIGMRFIYGAAFFGAQAFVPLMLTQHRRLPVTAAGLILTVGSLGWSAGAWWQGRQDLRMSRYLIVRLGAALVTISAAVNVLVVFETVPVGLAALGCLLGGLGMGLGRTSLTVLLLTNSAPETQGKNSAAGQVSESLGQVLSIALGGALLASLHDMLIHGTVFIPVFAVMISIGLLGTAATRLMTPERDREL